MSEQPSNMEELQARLIARAWDDEEFKRRLLSDPKAAIGDELDIELPEDLEIEVVEETATKICLVLPVSPRDGSDQELLDEAIDAVAGGIIGYPGMHRAHQTVPTSPHCSGFQRIHTLTDLGNP